MGEQSPNLALSQVCASVLLKKGTMLYCVWVLMTVGVQIVSADWHTMYVGRDGMSGCYCWTFIVLYAQVGGCMYVH